MSSNQNNRVLNRVGARQLTADETRRISGNGINTRASMTITGSAKNPDEHFDE